jgi:hypothetical protein
MPFEKLQNLTNLSITYIALRHVNKKYFLTSFLLFFVLPTVLIQIKFIMPPFPFA